jgi:hypothetical protein
MKKKSVGLLELEMAVLECFLEKTPLSPLGVKNSLSTWSLKLAIENLAQWLSFNLFLAFSQFVGNE